MSGLKTPLLILLSGAFILACDSTYEGPRPTNPTSYEGVSTSTAPGSTQAAPTVPPPPPTDATEKIRGQIAAAKIRSQYAFILAMDTGTQICTGQVQLHINGNLDATQSLLSIDNSTASCLGGLINLDVTALLNGFINSPSPASSETDLPVEADKTQPIIRQKRVDGEKSFSPARPLLPSVVAGTRDQLSRLNISEQIAATDKATGITGTGMVTLKTTSFDQPYQSPNMNYQFQKAMTWEATATGFETVDKSAFLLFDRIEIVFNLAPVAIPSMKIRAKLVDFLNIKPGTVLPLIGDLNEALKDVVLDISLNLMAMDGLKPQ